jgi:hypothetical protein
MVRRASYSGDDMDMSDIWKDLSGFRIRMNGEISLVWRDAIDLSTSLLPDMLLMHIKFMADL